MLFYEKVLAAICMVLVIASWHVRSEVPPVEKPGEIVLSHPPVDARQQP